MCSKSNPLVVFALDLMSISESFISSGKQGGAVILREGRDIVTKETCIPTSLNFPLLWPGLCQFQPTDKYLRKNS
jgi:hypothetical protein